MSWWQPVWATASRSGSHPAAQAQEAMVPTPLPSHPCRRVGSSQPPAQLSPTPGGATAVQASASGVSPSTVRRWMGWGARYRQERGHTPLPAGPLSHRLGTSAGCAGVGCRSCGCRCHLHGGAAALIAPQRVCAESLGRTEHQSPSSHLGGHVLPTASLGSTPACRSPGGPLPLLWRAVLASSRTLPSAPLPSLMLSLRLACGLPIPSLPSGLLSSSHPFASVLDCEPWREGA